MKYTYLMRIGDIQKELDNLWKTYQEILNKSNPTWEEINEARAILYLTGQIYCEQIAIDSIERRLHLLKKRISLIEFLNLIDSNSKKLNILRKDKLFIELEMFYKIIKGYKNKYLQGRFYLEEEKFINLYNKINPKGDLKIGYKGGFDEKSLSFMIKKK